MATVRPRTRLARLVEEAADHILGDVGADITLVEYGSYACPHCRAANEQLTENAHSDVVNFTLPPFAGGTRWLCLIDTNDPDRADIRPFQTGDQYAVTSRSVLLFAALTGETARAVRRTVLELTRDVSVG